MPQSLSNVILHIVFGTHKRQPVLHGEIRPRMHAYLATLCRELNAACYQVGGVSDHVHVVASLPRTLTQSQMVENLKKKSSKWIKTIHTPSLRSFQWQRGYATFSVSPSHLTSVIEYAANQAAHHKTLTFQDEYRRLLKQVGIEYDEKYLWD